MAPRLIEQLLLCQADGCHAPLAQGCMPWTTGHLDIICGKCQQVSRFELTPAGILAQVIPPSARLTPRART